MFRKIVILSVIFGLACSSPIVLTAQNLNDCLFGDCEIKSLFPYKIIENRDMAAKSVVNPLWDSAFVKPVIQTVNVDSVENPGLVKTIPLKNYKTVVVQPQEIADDRLLAQWYQFGIEPYWLKK